MPGIYNPLWFTADPFFFTDASLMSYNYSIFMEIEYKRALLLARGTLDILNFIEGFTQEGSY